MQLPHPEVLSSFFAARSRASFGVHGVFLGFFNRTSSLGRVHPRAPCLRKDPGETAHAMGTLNLMDECPDWEEQAPECQTLAKPPKPSAVNPE